MNLAPELADGSPASQAGEHPFQLTTTLNFNETLTKRGVEGEFLRSTPTTIKDVQVDLPPGMIGNPIPFPQCSEDDFARPENTGVNTCPDKHRRGRRDGQRRRTRVRLAKKRSRFQSSTSNMDPVSPRDWASH